MNEVELGYNLHKNGFGIFCLPKAEMYHLCGAGGRVSKTEYNLAVATNEAAFIKKHGTALKK